MAWSALLWTLLAQAIGGITPALTKLALTGFDPWTLVASQQVLGLLALLLLARLRGDLIAEERPLSARDWGWLVCMAWLGCALPLLLLVSGIARSTATHAALMAPIEPLAVLVGAAICFRQRLTSARAIAIALGVLGSGAIALGSAFQRGAGELPGDLLIWAGSIAGGLYALAARPLLARHPARRVVLWAAALSVPPLVTRAAFETGQMTTPSPLAIGALVALGLASTALAESRARQSIRNRRTAALIFAQPLLGLGAGAWLLGESCGAPAWIGAALIASGVTWAAMRGETETELQSASEDIREPAAAPAEHSAADALEDPGGAATDELQPAAAAPPEGAAPAEPAARAASAAPQVGAGPAHYLALHEVVSAARAALPDGLWHYLVGGAETETTVARNRRALDSLALRPRVLRDVSEIDASITCFGQRLRIPVALAPIGGLESLHPDGALASARAAAAFGTAVLQSSVCAPSLEVTSGLTDATRIFQLYVRGDTEWIDAQVERAIACGCTAFCITVDTAIYSRRERDLVTRLEEPWRERATGFRQQAALSWKYIEHYKQRFAMPLLLKGIATAADALLACEHGVDAIYVSNHGGRQLDHGRGAVAVLAEVVDAVAGRSQIWVDGGFSRGTDVVKALALGAQVVGIGRLHGYGIAAGGEAGAVRVLELLESEIRTALGLLGVTRIAELDRSYVERVEPLGTAHALSAFPLIGMEPARS